MTKSDGDTDATLATTTAVSVDHGVQNAAFGTEHMQLREVEELDVEAESQSDWHVNRKNGAASSSTLSVSAVGDIINEGGNAKIDISVEGVDEIQVQDLWTDWEIIDKQTETDGAQFSNQITSTGKCGFVWNSNQASASPSLTVSPPDRYIGGEYEFEISAIQSNSAVTTTATVNIHTDCSIEISGPDAPGMESFDTLIPELMNDWGLFGGSVAVVKDGQLVFARGYGMSDDSCESVVQPETRFRIASVSKPITSVGILILKENNQISLDDKAFNILDHLKPTLARLIHESTI